MRFERTRPDGRVIEVRRNPVPGGGFGQTAARRHGISVAVVMPAFI
jgi:hypothetical protein